MATIFLSHSPAMLEHYYGEQAVAGLRALGELRINDTGDHLDTEQLIAAARGCQVIVSDRMTAGPAPVFEQLPDLIAFVRCAVDIRTIDVAAASAHGVLITQASPGFIQSVAELVIGMMVDLGRHVSDAVIGYRQQQTPKAVMGRQLNGSTLGVIGYGSIGRYLSQLGIALGMRVLVCDPFVEVAEPGLQQMELPGLLEQSDFVVCLVVANEKTENLMDAQAFAQMKPGAFFVNVSRGNLVDEAALTEALTSGHIAGAALDVGRAPDQMPSPALTALPNVVATPHIGGLTPQAIAHQALETVGQVAEIIKGKAPKGAVNAASATRLTRFQVI